MRRSSYWSAIRGLIGGVILGIAVAVLLMWGGTGLLDWQSKLGSVILTVLLFALAGGVGGLFMGRNSS
jgi:hypothetical protein